MKSQNQKLKEKAWKLFSQYIRRKYSNEDGTCTCFTCDKIFPSYKDLQAGHAIPGRKNYVLFLEEVCRPQCPRCNLHYGLKGNYQEFIPKLVELYGLDQYQEWVRESKKPLKRTKGDYEQLIDELTEQLKEFDEQGK